MDVKFCRIDGLVLITPKRFADDRGYFQESFKSEWFLKNVSDINFVQDNEALSTKTGTVRGLHFQRAPYGQGKLVSCVRGAIFDVAVDIRKGSASFGKWFGTNLTADNGCQFWIPEGFAHGYCTLEPETVVQYKVTAPYSPTHEGGIAFDDPAIAVNWPVSLSDAIVSDKDRRQPLLSQASLL